MRIVIDMQGAQTESRYRGIGRYTMSFAQAIVRNRGEHEIILVLNGLFPDTIEPIRAAFEGLLPQENIRVWHAPGPVKGIQPDNGTRYEIAELMREAFIASLNPDIVHITSLFEGFVDDAVTSIGRFDASTPVSVTLYDLIPLLNPKQYLQPNPDYKTYYQRKVKWLENASLMLAISNYTKQEAIQALGGKENKIVSISTAIEENFQKQDISSEKAKSVLGKYSINSPFVLYTGGADERKNLPRLIQAYAKLTPEIRKQHQLVFAGRMPEGDVKQFKAIAAESGLKADEYIFVGYISEDDLIALYNLCKLYVFPSWHEGFGLPALEAMACAAPVIGANTTSLPEVIGLKDALFDPFDVQSITKKMQQALTDEKFRQKLIDHSAHQVKKFSWDKTAQCAISHWALKVEKSNSIIWSSWHSEQEVKNKKLYDLIAYFIESFDNSRIASCSISIAKNIREAGEYWRSKHAETMSNSLKWRLEGPFDSSYSLALLNREFAKALHELGHHVSLHSTEGPGDFDPSEDFLLKNPLLQELNLSSKKNDIKDADVCSRNLYPPRVTGMDAPINILHSYGWEESSFPLEWVDNFNDYLQGITVMSRHCKELLINSGVRVPIAVTGLGVDHWERVTPDSGFKSPGKKFRFLHVSSCFPRKGVDVMLKAFGMSFTSRDDVSLIIKTFPNPHNEIHKWLKEAKNSFIDYPDVILIEDDLSDNQLKSLYNQCHALVAPSRAEGFGLPMAEAMLSGLSVITTGWSGQTDFCNSETAWLIDYEYSWAKTHFNLFSSVWAEPKADHLSELMRKLFDLPESERIKKSLLGRKLLKDKFKWKDIAERNVEFVCNYPYKFKNNVSEKKIAWISTWNTRCGIASYSGHLVRHLQSKASILAPLANELISHDGENVTRCWHMDDQDRLEHLNNAIDSINPSSIVIQFNYGFFNLENLSNFLHKQVDSGRNVFITLHSTTDPAHAPRKKLSILAPALKKVKRVLVHTPSDLNRLKEHGVTNNAMLFPHGIIDHQPTNIDNLKKNDEYVIGSYGFFLPHKGLLQLIKSIKLLRNTGLGVKLIMVNSEFPVPESKHEIHEAKKLITALNLDDNVELHTGFLPDNESLALLEKAELIVFPYQNTGESSSAAVRYGVASGRDVAVTPLNIFDDISRITYRLPGFTPEDIAKGILDWIKKSNAEDIEILQLRKNAESWRNQHRYSKISSQLEGILVGSLNE